MLLSPAIYTQLRLGMLRVGEELIVEDSMIARVATQIQCGGLSEAAWILGQSFIDREYEMRWDETGTVVTYKRIS